MKRSEDLKVFISSRDSLCEECGESLGNGAWITLVEGKGALCLSCADLDHLNYLRSGDAALSRRARKHSILSAVVLKWSRARKRYERQGLLVESRALERAESECLADSEAMARRREREAQRRVGLDRRYVEQFAARVRELFPGCPTGREVLIAEHACLKYSGRIGRSAAAKSLAEEAVGVAVTAHVRHAETRYDELLAAGHDKWDARGEVEQAVQRLLANWQESVTRAPVTGSLDLHTFNPREVKDLVPTYLDACVQKGMREVRIIHGKGQGVLARIVRAALDCYPNATYRPGESWGVTLVHLQAPESEDDR